MRRRAVGIRTLVGVGLVVCLLLAGVVSVFASSSPDGLQHVADTLGFASSATPHASDGSPLAGYGVRGVHDSRLSGGLAGVIGVVLVGVLAFGLTWALRRRAPGGHDREDR
ncbi:MAG: PDGLE domain-containing protein [Dermatophilaceae bacterium]